jgi:predicted TIM-barrel fold metal-dependent hydrolase
MARPYNVIDADGHVLEPMDMWEKYIDPAFRERAPRLVIDTDGRERLLVETQVLGSSKGFGVIGAIGARDTEMDDGEMTYADGRPGGFDPHKRIPDMDLDGIDAAFLYPSVGLFAGAVKDPELAAAMCRAYNRWLADYCRPYPDRLFGVAMLPMQSIPLAIEEMRFARKELGMRGGFLRPNPYNDKMLHHPDYEPFWSAAEDLDFSIGLHEGASGGMPQAGVDRFAKRGAKHIVSHTVEMMLAAMSVIWEGVCDRHPRVRIAFLESGGGWIAGWLDRMDRHFDDKGFNDSGLSMRPSDLFQRNCWISFEPVEGSLNVLADYIGPHKILWATDYPHPDGFFPGAPAMIAGRPELSEATKREILGGGARRFYGLDRS